MPVIFENTEIGRPWPLVTLSRTSVKNSEGVFSHYLYSITLRGWILNIDTDKDSYGSDDYPMTQDGLMAGQKYILDAFSVEGGRLEITSPDGGGPNSLDFYCTVDSVNFEESVWVNLDRYTVNLTAIGDANDEFSGLENYSETWTLTENENGTHSVVHAITAKGFPYYKIDGLNSPLAEAKAWVQARQYGTSTDGIFVPTTLPGSLTSPSGILSNIASISTNYWDKSTVETFDPVSYTYGLTETFVYSPEGSANEEWSANVSYNQENTRKVDIAINGVVTGHSDRLSSRDQRLLNAKNKFFTQIEPNLYTRLTNYVPSGYTLNPSPITKQQTYDPGVFRYSYNFSANYGSLIPNAVEENITISDNGAADVFASIGIPGRSSGPLIQSMGTKQAAKRNIVINARMAPPSTPVTLSSLRSQFYDKPNTDAVIQALTPSVGYYYTEADTEDYSPISRQYSRSMTWVLTSPSASGLPNIIHNIP